MQFRIFGGFNEDEAETLEGKSLKTLLCEAVKTITSIEALTTAGHSCSKSEKEVIEYLFSSHKLAYFKDNTKNKEIPTRCSSALFGGNPKLVDAFIKHYTDKFESPVNQYNIFQAAEKTEIVQIK